MDVDRFKREAISEIIEDLSILLDVSKIEMLKIVVDVATEDLCPQGDCPRSISCEECWASYIFDRRIVFSRKEQ